ncbi:hypothetical protein [Vulcanisaeta distributa]|uniref:hypothetical protein n=1 Tax=Vulcanisaeta distributa TaxID=164451 RepID=UPI001FB28036|nr:hypothetical protein [Vulcanisaeta distributa]
MPLGLAWSYSCRSPSRGAYYFTVLERYDPYIVSNIAGPLLGYDPGTALFYPAFYTAIALTIALGVTALYAFYAVMRGGRVVRPAVISTGILAEVILVLMEYVNDGSRYPYLFISGGSGIPITQLLNTLIPLPPNRHVHDAPLDDYIHGNIHVGAILRHNKETTTRGVSLLRSIKQNLNDL